jgi:monoamine oxidase
MSARRRLKRREFLWVSATTTASLLAAACGYRRVVAANAGRGLPQPNGGADGVADCIVLGAGIAGVTAARDLQRKGLRVILVEGSTRVGGRMYSKRDLVLDPEAEGKYLPVEAGAEYIHVGNSVRYREFWDELTRHGFTTSKFPKTAIQDPGQKARNRLFFPVWRRTRTTDGALIHDAEIRGASPMLFLVKLKRLFDLGGRKDVAARVFANSQGYQGRGITITEYTLSAHTPGLLDDPPPDLPPGQHNPNDTISISGIVADEIPDQLTEPAEYRLERERTSTTRICGYDTLPRKICDEFVAAGGTLAKSDGDGSALKVVRVERRADGTITVATKGGQRFAARSAICTFSVGMLDPVTGEGDAIFGDLLDEEKRRALEVVKMGAITKFSLAFKQRLWQRHGGGRMSVLSNPAGKARTFFSAFPDEPCGPHVLTALLMGKDHLAIRKLSDEKAIRFLLEELQAIYEPEGPRWTPERVLAGERNRDGTYRPRYLRQDWEKDEFAKGGNSFLRFHPAEAGEMEVTGAREALKNPRETLPLFWAGEATAPAYQWGYQPLAVHGAYISGRRAAEDVHHYLTVCQGDPKRFNKYYKKRYRWQSPGLLAPFVGFFEGLFS